MIKLWCQYYISTDVISSMTMSASISLPRREVSQCLLCGLQGVQPKLLPCLHTFCLKCLESVRQRLEKSPWMACPTCSTEFKVPQLQGLLGLPSDIFVERLVKTQKGVCDVCSDDQSYIDARIPPASKYCPLCCQGLCERCSVEHSRQKLLKAHALVDFSVGTAMEQARLHPSNICPKHLTVLSTQFCMTCQRFVCNVCLLEDHIEHDWSKWEEVVDRFRNNLKQNVEQVSGLLGDVVKRREKEMEKEVRQFDTRTTEIESQIRERCGKLRKLIDGHEDALLWELKVVKEARLMQMDDEMNKKFETFILQLKTFKNYCIAVTESGSPNEIDWAVNDLNLRKRYEELKKQSDAFADSNPHLSSFVEVSFELPDTYDILDNPDLVGTVTSQTVARPTRLDTSGKEVWGVTSMNNYIYVLSDDSVFVYDPEEPSKPINEIDIPEKKYPTDIAASPKDRCLYVTDQGDSSPAGMKKESCIWKVEKQADTYIVSRWLTITVRLFTLSVSEKGHVTVPVSKKDSNELQIYSNRGTQMNAIKLPMEIVFLNHAIELANGNFMVAFGKTGAYKHGICEVSSSGEIVHSISDSEVLNHPWHVTIFAKEGILLADSKNNRVLWLDSNLDVKKELLTEAKDGIIEPRRMCYAKQSNLLLIVHSCHDGKRVVDLYNGNRWIN